MNKCELINLSKERLNGIIFSYMIEKDNLIKYLEDDIKECEEELKYFNTDIGEIELMSRIKAYQDILERLKNNNYE